MSKNKITDKLKEGVSVHEIEIFARKYIAEVFMIAPIVIGAISSAFDFFTGPKMTIYFFALGAILGILFPDPVDKGLKQMCRFAYKQEKMTQMVLGAVNVVVSLFIPFVLFGVLGLLSGGAYHYYTRRAHNDTQSSIPNPRRGISGEEHD